jgi:tRNA G18 (ribose-2'-O)-methylase SpoU
MNLYIAHVGYYDSEIGIYELHTNIHVVATDVKAARDTIKNLPIYQAKNMHIDGIEELLSIDGYNIHATKNNSTPKKNRTFNHEDLKTLL